MDVGRISFGNTRAGVAIDTLKEEILDKYLWEDECMKKDEEIERLKNLLKSRRIKNVRG